jgi:hypothetical protein
MKSDRSFSNKSLKENFIADEPVLFDGVSGSIVF